MTICRFQPTKPICGDARSCLSLHGSCKQHPDCHQLASTQVTFPSLSSEWRFAAANGVNSASPVTGGACRGSRAHRPSRAHRAATADRPRNPAPRREAVPDSGAPVARSRSRSGLCGGIASSRSRIAESLGEILLREVNLPQVVEHASQNLALADRLQKFGLQLHLGRSKSRRAAAGIRCFLSMRPRWKGSITISPDMTS